MSEGIDEVRRVLGTGEAIEPEHQNVTPLRHNPEKLKPKAKNLLASVVWAGNIEPQLDRPYLVKGWLDRGAVSVVYGPSNVGKSFLVLNIAHHVAKGMSWGGRRVSEGRVLYIGAEGGASLNNRIAALDDPKFFLLPTAITLTGPASQAGPLAEVLQHLAAIGGGNFDLIVIDTLARVMGGLDENHTPDIADLVRNLDLIRRATGAHVMLVHHTGKDTTRGARGSSSLRAAIDTEIELKRDDLGIITAEVKKQRDGPTGYKFNYQLRQVDLGWDQDGDQITTCLVEPVDNADASRVVVTEAAQGALSVLDRVLSEKGKVVRGPSYPGTPCVTLEEWREACLEIGAVSSSENDDTRARMFRKCRDQLTQAGLVLVRNELVFKVQK